jgi:hypothetical protein
MQLRLPALLATNAILVVAGIIRTHVFPEGLGRLLLGRVCALVLGAALEVRRRALFIQLSAATGEVKAGSAAASSKGPGCLYASTG